MYTELLDTINRRKRLTANFSYDEMTKTSTGLDNTPDFHAFQNLLYLCRILESVRNRFGCAIPITSGYRSVEVNNHPDVAGSKNSFHLDGRAVDIYTGSWSKETTDKLEEILWNYNPVELIRYSTRPIIHVAF